MSASVSGLGVAPARCCTLHPACRPGARRPLEPYHCQNVTVGASWLCINDDAHQWGHRFRAISGEPRRYGRVYIAIDGRGLLYGDPVPATSN